jgi:hypothetical protein
MDPYTVGGGLDPLDRHAGSDTEHVGEVAPRRVHPSVDMEERPDRERSQPRPHQRARHVLEAGEERALEVGPHDPLPGRLAGRAERIERRLGVVGVVDHEIARLARQQAGHEEDEAGLVGGAEQVGAQDATDRVRRGVALAVEQEVATTAQLHRREPLALTELVEQRQRGRIEARQPTGAGVDPVPLTVVFGVGTSAGDRVAFDDIDVEASLNKAVGGSQPGRPGADDDDARH